MFDSSSQTLWHHHLIVEVFYWSVWSETGDLLGLTLNSLWVRLSLFSAASDGRNPEQGASLSRGAVQSLSFGANWSCSCLICCCGGGLAGGGCAPVGALDGLESGSWIFMFVCVSSWPRSCCSVLSVQDLDDIEDENEQLKQENKTLLKVVGQLTR